jgi:GntR family transcriptional regulator/MocR family aminotransferase
VPAQLALADYIARGDLDRHLRRMRVRYAAARERLLAALAAALPGARVGGVAAGLFVPVALPAARAGAGAGGLLGIGEPVGAGGIDLLLGFAGYSEAAIADAVAMLAARVHRCTD